MFIVFTMDLFTNRLHLRTLITNDYIGYYEIYSDRSTAQLAGVKWLRNYEDAKLMVDLLLRDRKLEVVTILNLDDSDLIGTLSFLKIDHGRGVEIGYAIKNTYRQQGIAEEAIRNSLREFKRLKIFDGVNYFQAVINSNNFPSQKFIEKLGFKYTYSQNFSFKNEISYFFMLPAYKAEF